ncbi:DUF192 domain-containing protein [Haladaptatus caseinilyticus]|uniref:DUF192 domain-containing protein n=1 Tax=Haladaptatus caseinilyticus TaxID=2993314 RepID=UPI00224A685F|nr:DUF192 domain-containing protein [Haladaptatus caseinilyticus]
MRVTPALLVICLVVLAGCTGGLGIGSDGPMQTEKRSNSSATTNTDGNISAAFVANDGRTNVTLEVANSDGERTRGLMYRESLPQNHGMVFVFESAQPQSFWMKNTVIPLDIIFIAPNGTVINVEHADPQPDANELDLRSYRSDAPAKYVVEMRQGFANRTGIEPGTKFKFDGKRPSTES